MIINKKVFVDYCVLTLFVVSSGVPYFHHNAISVFQFLILFIIFILRKKSFNASFLFFFIILVAISLLQALKFQFFSVITNMGLFIMVANAYLIIKIVEDKFIAYYITILYYMAIISFIFYFPILFFSSVEPFLYHRIVPIFDFLNIADSKSHSFIIYNMGHTVYSSVRNSGPFWEPGAFAGYLIIAYIFNFVTETKKINKKNIVLLIAIVTTLSTTAYLALFIFLFFYYYKKIKNIAIKAIAVIIIIIMGVYAYTTFEFLGAKIERQLEVAQNIGIQKSDNTQRFLSILRDVQDFKGHELIGRGGHDLTRYDYAPGKFLIRTVGLTDILVRVGIIYYILMFYFLYKSICVYLSWLQEKKQLYCIGIFVSILVTLMSEVYFGYPMYWSLLFLQFGYRQKEKVKVE